MRESSYNTIVKCLTFGVPAIAKEIVEELNNDINSLYELTAKQKNEKLDQQSKKEKE